MPLYMGDKPAVVYKGDAKPVNLYQGAHKVAGWKWAEQSGADMAFERAYNDRVDVEALGRSKQDGTPSPAYPSPIISAAGGVQVEGRNLLVATRTMAINDEVAIRQGIIIPDEKFRGCSVLKTSRPWQGYKFRFDLIAARRGIKVGDTVTYSIWAKTDGTPTKNVSFTFYTTPSGLEGVVKKLSPSQAQTWTQLKHTFVVTEAHLAVTSMRIESDYYEGAPPDYNTYLANVLFAAPQLERGNETHNHEDYRPIITHELPVLRGIPDGAGGWAARDTLEVVAGRWRLTQRIHRLVLDGTENWILSSTFFYWHSLPIPGGTLKKDGLCSHFRYELYSGGCIGVSGAGNLCFARTDALYPYTAEGLAAWKTWLNVQHLAGMPVTVDYVLAEPIIHDLGPADLPSYYPHTRVLVEGDYPPEVVARCRVVE